MYPKTPTSPLQLEREVIDLPIVEVAGRATPFSDHDRHKSWYVILTSRVSPFTSTVFGSSSLFAPSSKPHSDEQP